MHIINAHKQISLLNMQVSNTKAKASWQQYKWTPAAFLSSSLDKANLSLISVMKIQVAAATVLVLLLFTFGE